MIDFQAKMETSHFNFKLNHFCNCAETV